MPDVRPSPLAVLSKILNRARARGPREVVALGVDRARGWASSGDVLVMFVRDSETSAEEIAGLRFRAAGPGDAVRYARDIGTDSAATFAARLSDGTHCFVVEDGDRFLHASWVTTAGAWTRELRTYLMPPQGDAYIYESFTRSDARGRGVYPFALRHIVSWGAEATIARLWVAVEAHNSASLRAVAKAGFVEAFRLPFTRRFGRLTVGGAEGPHAELAPGFLSRTRPVSDL